MVERMVPVDDVGLGSTIRSWIRCLSLGALVALASAACAPAPSPAPASPQTAPTAEVPSDGPPQQPARPTALREGADWELLADVVRGAEAGTIDVVTTREAFIDAWLRVYPTRVVPDATLEDPIYMFFNLLVQAGCPGATIDAVILDGGQDLLYGEFTRLPGRPSCGDIAGAHSFIVAIDRAALPADRLTIRIEREFSVCADCGREREETEVDLTR